MIFRRYVVLRCIYDKRITMNLIHISNSDFRQNEGLQVMHYVQKKKRNVKETWTTDDVPYQKDNLQNNTFSMSPELL